MSKKNPRGALVGGLILISLGLLFLMNNWLPDWSVWGLVRRYWPVVLLWIGLRSLYLYFTYTPPSPPALPPTVPTVPTGAGWAGSGTPPPS